VRRAERESLRNQKCNLVPVSLLSMRGILLQRGK
jgi:hypothetical protein